MSSRLAPSLPGNGGVSLWDNTGVLRAFRLCAGICEGLLIQWVARIEPTLREWVLSVDPQCFRACGRSARRVADGDGDADSAQWAFPIPPPWGIRMSGLRAGCAFGCWLRTRNVAVSQAISGVGNPFPIKEMRRIDNLPTRSGHRRH
jgi:hypothetical protein